MKKLLLILLALSIQASSIAQINTYKNVDEALRSLMSTHTRVFSKANLILNYSPADEHKAWMEMVESLQTYAQKKQPKELKKASDTLFAIAFQIEDSLHSIFEKLIRPALLEKKAQEEGISASSITQKIDYESLKLDTAKLDMQMLTKRVADVKSFKNLISDVQMSFTKDAAIVKACKKAADQCKLLSQLALVLELTVEKVGKDFDIFKKEIERRTSQKPVVKPIIPKPTPAKIATATEKLLAAVDGERVTLTIAQALKNGADVNAFDTSGETTLIKVVKSNLDDVDKRNIVKMLLAHGADATHEDRNFKNALNYATDVETRVMLVDALAKQTR